MRDPFTGRRQVGPPALTTRTVPVHEEVCGGWTACDRRIHPRDTRTTQKAAEVTCPGCREARAVAEAHMAQVTR